jgi:hypothetical protein
MGSANGYDKRLDAERARATVAPTPPFAVLAATA